MCRNLDDLISQCVLIAGILGQGITPSVQFGFEVEGLATSIPAAAPEALEPSGPRLSRTPWRAIGLSVAIQSSSATRFRKESVGMASAGENSSNAARPAETRKDIRVRILSLGEKDSAK
jgi:hypothetical protein